MIILPCLPFFLAGGYVTHIFLLTLLFAGVVQLIRR